MPAPWPGHRPGHRGWGQLGHRRRCRARPCGMGAAWLARPLNAAAPGCRDARLPPRRPDGLYGGCRVGL